MALELAPRWDDRSPAPKVNGHDPLGEPVHGRAVRRVHGDNRRQMSYSSAGIGRGSRSSGDDQSLLRYGMVLRERVWIILACTILVLAAAVAYVEVAPKKYQAEAEMEVEAASPNDATLSSLPVLHQTGDPTEDVLTGASLVTTAPVAQAVVRALHLDMSAAGALQTISATPVGQAGLVAVQATASSPALAERLADAFVTQTILRSTATMHAAISSELPTLQNQLTSVPLGERYAPGSLGEQLDELQQLLHTNDPTLVFAAPASLPTAPSSPKKKLTLIAGLVGGLLVGIGAAFLFHALDPRLRRDDQLRERFGLPVLARIPREPRGNRARPLLPSELSAAGHEGYRTLRTILAARAPAGEPRVVLITGSAPAEGKSTTAMGLAAGLAQAGARVLLIEADLRKPTFANSFNLRSFVGVQNVLLGKTDIAHAIVPVSIDGARVRVLAAYPTAGEKVGMPVAAVRKLVNDAKAVADFVIIDSAPLTAVIDALPFAQAADEVVVVARLDETRLNKLDDLDDLLSQHGIRRSGVVLIGDQHTRPTDHYYAPQPNGTSRSAAPSRSTASTRASVRDVVTD
jgi:capsular exopolysaccharide synthesis family protein